MKNAGPCAKCKCEVWIPDELYGAARHSEKVGFFCSYGHSLMFPQGESVEDKLRRERDRLAQQIAYKDDRIKQLREDAESADRRAAAARGQVTKLKKRASAGTCPCCSRTFSNMAEHMKKQHPEFVADGGAKVTPLKVVHGKQPT